MATRRPEWNCTTKLQKLEGLGDSGVTGYARVTECTMTRHGLEPLTLERIYSMLQSPGPSPELGSPPRPGRIAGQAYLEELENAPMKSTARRAHSTSSRQPSIARSTTVPSRPQSATRSLVPAMTMRQRTTSERQSSTPVRWSSSLQQSLAEETSQEKPVSETLNPTPSLIKTPSQTGKEGELERLTETVEALTPHDVTSYTSLASVPGSPRSQSEEILGDAVSLEKQKRREQSNRGAEIYEMLMYEGQEPQQ